MRWENKFPNHILNRGYTYFRQERVTEFQYTNTEMHAVVLGTSDYRVQISFNDRYVTDMICECPHASDGNNCKHCAAVLYHYKDIIDNSPEEKLKLATQLAETSGDDLRIFLSEIF